jgi:hypothetical protein
MILPSEDSPRLTSFGGSPTPMSSVIRPAVTSRFGYRGRRQPDPEFRTAERRLSRMDLAAVVLHDRVDDIEP